MLKFSPANAKTKALSAVPELADFLSNGRKIYSLDLLSGFSCPNADKCLSKAIVVNGRRKVKDGPNTEFRCFSASQETQYTGVYNLRKHNFDLLKSSKNKFDLLSQSMPKNLGICRIHVAGDFFSQDYLNAWVKMAIAYPDRLFYAYTKSLNFWVREKSTIDQLDNLVMTASFGGRLDHIIIENGLRFTKVVFSKYEADDLPIDHDDSHAARPSMSEIDFALLIHGPQPANSDAGKGVRELKGIGSYNRKMVLDK